MLPPEYDSGFLSHQECAHVLDFVFNRNFPGEACEGDPAEAQDCEITPCPVDCKISDWSTVGDCSESCGGGTLPQERTILSEAQFGADPCPGDLQRLQPCNEQPCPIDCELSEWAEENPCTVTCGGGTNTMTRQRVQRPYHGGVKCPTVAETQACNTAACPTDCALS